VREGEKEREKDGERAKEKNRRRREMRELNNERESSEYEIRETKWAAGSRLFFFFSLLVVSFLLSMMPSEKF
jgi:hypothetical protein